MDQKNVKKRDVWTFEEFAKSYDQARKTVMTKDGENPHPGAHEIKAEGAYVRHDANPYKAFGIEHDKKEANINDRMNANRVHIFDQTKNNRVDVITGGKGVAEGAAKALDLILNTQGAVLLDESATFNIQDVDKKVKLDNEEEEK